MKELEIEWDEFIIRLKNQEIKPWVDPNKGHALMKSKHAPRNWRITVRILSFISVWSIPISIVLIFFIKWWIPLLMIFFSLLLIKAIREESAKAVIKTSLDNADFYTYAILSRTLKVYSNS